MTTIVFCSQTGHTREYAEMLSQATCMESLPLEQAKARLDGESPVIYLGWVKAQHIVGIDDAMGRLRVVAACAVGMNPDMGELPQMRKNHALPGELPLFYLQGGLAPKRLKGVDRLIISLVRRSMRTTLGSKQDRSAAEEDMLRLATEGGSRVRRENLAPVLAWFQEAGLS